MDLRPRLILLPPGLGALVILIDPTSLTGGSVVLPGLGAVPYTLTLDASSGAVRVLVTFATPLGDRFLSLDPFASGGEGGTVPIPGLGDVLYTVVLGPPAIPAEGLLGTGLPLGVLIIALVGVGVWMLLQRVH